MNIEDMPKYDCIEVVRAMRIEEVAAPEDIGFPYYEMRFALPGIAAQAIPRDWYEGTCIAAKVDTLVGGYLIFHEYGSKSWLDRETFEARYQPQKDPQ